jgi:branched-subunit amino acid aminotransferase/4-amino-4-deoxychorismate lyase
MISEHSWPTELKCRSRMHYYLADLEAGRKHHGARAILCDSAGRVRETAIANVLLGLATDGGVTLVSPPRNTILPGISLKVAIELAAQLGWRFEERNFTLDDLAEADEVLLTSTPWCVLPVTQYEERAIGTGAPGPIFAGLMKAWSALVGLDIVAQAEKLAT